MFAMTALYDCLTPIDTPMRPFVCRVSHTQVLTS